MESARSVGKVIGQSTFAAAIAGSLLAILASVATWGVLHSKHRFFLVDSSFDIGMGAPNDARLRLAAETSRIDRLNAAISLAIGGGLLAVALSLVSNSCCAWPVRIITGAIWGAICGAGAGFIGPMVFDSLMTDENLPSATTSGIGQAVVYGCIGFGVGLLYGAFSRSWATFGKASVIGAFAGILGGVVYPIVASVIMPSQNTGTFISDVSVVRLVWLTVPFALIGFALPYMSNQVAQESSPVIEIE